MNAHYSPTDYDRLMDAAKARAAQLRREAVGEFWSGTGRRAWGAVRSAQRLARSLARHTRLRGGQEA